MAENKIRLSLELPAALNRRLDEMAEQLGGTKSEVLRRAIALLDVSHRATLEGKRVGIAKSDSPLETEFYGL